MDYKQPGRTNLSMPYWYSIIDKLNETKLIERDNIGVANTFC